MKKKVLNTLLLSLAVTPLFAADIACKSPTQAFSNLDKILKSYNIHPHVLMQSNKIAGHLRNVDLEEGATLYLSKK